MRNGVLESSFSYILSAGRTGTVFLEKLVTASQPEVVIEHEPHPSRYLMMLGNMRNDLGRFRRLTQRWSRAQQARRHGGCNRYIEVNPFLCAVADTLPGEGRSLRIVHMVRHPASWARSIPAFRASSKYRFLVDYVPFAKPYPSPRPAGWKHLDEYERALWRWDWCNSRIDALKSTAEQYVIVRYEDLFNPDLQIRMTAVARIFEVFGLENRPEADASIFNEQINPAPVGPGFYNAQAIAGRCGTGIRI